MVILLTCLIVLLLSTVLWFLLSSNDIKNRKKLLHLLELDCWVDRRYAIRFNEYKKRYELLDFVRWENDTRDTAHMLYILEKVSMEEDATHAYLIAQHRDGTMQTIPIDNAFGFNPLKITQD